MTRSSFSRNLARQVGLDACFAGILFLGTSCHRNADDQEQLAPTVAAVRVARADLAQELVFPAEFHPWYAVDLHAKVAGFVKNLSVDLGSRVKAGDILAELDIPLLAEDIAGGRALLRRSESEVQRAEAAAEDAHIGYTRLAAVSKADPQLLAQQEIDTAQEKDRSATAMLASAQQQVQVAQAALDRLLAEKADARLVAPFDGIVTELDANPGDLVQGGTSPSGQGKPLVRLAEIDHLRAAFSVSTSGLAQIHLGLPVEIRLDDGRVIKTKVARLSDEVSWSTRTMRVEADVPNSEFSLIPGMYASAVIKPEHRENALVLPLQAVQRGPIPTIWTVNAKGLIEDRLVKIGLQTPDRVEILSGATEGETVLLGNAAGIPLGTKVVPHFTTVLAAR
jgi:RND family efflux transporter MFP subunit